MRKFRHPIGLLTVAFWCLLAACASTPEGQRAERIVVQASVLAVIERAPDPSKKAQRITEAVKAARTLLLDDTVTVGALRGALLTRVADLSPAEKLVALEVINDLSDSVEKRVGSGILAADAKVSINTVLDWVTNAAAFYVPISPAT